MIRNKPSTLTHDLCFFVASDPEAGGTYTAVTKQERSWILYDVANSAYSLTVTTALFPIFFKTFAAKGVEGYTSTAWLGYGNSIYTLIIACLAPLLGTLADYRNSKKRLFVPFLLLGVLATLSFPLVQQGQWMTALTIYVLSALGFAGANIFYDSFLVDVTTRERMDWVSTSGFAWGYIGSTIPFVLGMVLILKHESLGFHSSVPAVRITFIVTALWWFAFSFPLLRNVKQVHHVQPSPRPVRDSFARLLETLRHIRGHRNVFLFLIAFFFYIDGVSTIIKMATAFGTDLGIGSNTLLLILLVIQVVAFPCALLYGKLAQLTSTKTMLFVGIIVYVIITLVASLLPLFPSVSTKVAVFWVLSILVASSQGGIQALSRSFYGKLIPKERSAEFFGFYNVFGRFSTIFGPFIMGLVSQTTRNSGIGILSVLILFVMGGILLTRVKPEGNETQEEKS